MSLLDQITLLCEGIDAGPDIRLLEIARSEIQVDLDSARKMSIRAAGSKADLVPTVRAYKRMNILAFAVRDRDFLGGNVLERMREQASVGDAAYPLNRYSIESYLLDPAFLRDALALEDAETRLERIAGNRRWLDVVRAVLDDLGYRVRRQRPQLEDDRPGDRETAIDVVSRKAGANIRALESLHESPTAEDLVDRFSSDFDNDGPLWIRVDGKELLSKLESEIGDCLPPGIGLKQKLLTHAELKGAPQPLVRDLRDFFQAIPGPAGPP